MRNLCTALLLFATAAVTAQQKKPLTHDVYDSWRSVGERQLSNDGKFAVYAVNPQEGDGNLTIRNMATGSNIIVGRGADAQISSDSRFVSFQIKPPFKETRQARIKKKKADEMPKDSLGIALLGTDSLVKIPLVKSFKIPEKGAGWLAYLAEKPKADSSRKKLSDSLKLKIDALVKLADSVIRRSLDSVKGNIDKEQMLRAARKAAREIYRKGDDGTEEDAFADAEGDDTGTDKTKDGTDLTLKNMNSGEEKTFKLVTEYIFDKKGSRLLIETRKNSKDSTGKSYVLIHDLQRNVTDTVMKGFNDAQQFAFDEDGMQLSFVAERDSAVKALQKFYRLWYYKPGNDSATVLADRNTGGIASGFTISENGELKFSKDGKKLFFGTAAVPPVKDTNLVDFELAKLDVWTYHDDYLQPQQIKQLSKELKRSYTAVAFPEENKVVQLGTDSSETITLINEGNADFILAQSTKGNRIASQWEGRTLTAAYLINVRDRSSRTLSKKALGAFIASPMGKYIYWYDPAQEHYFTYNIATGAVRNISEKIKAPLYNTENDVPDFPASAGTTGWTKDDRFFLVNDEYDIWRTDPDGVNMPVNLTNGYGRKNKINFDYIKTDKDKRFFEPGEKILLRSLGKTDKHTGFWSLKIDETANPVMLRSGPFSLSAPVKAKDADAYLFTKGSISSSELFSSPDLISAVQLTDVSMQQKDYNWLTAELMHWKMFDGKMSEALLFKPENFDPNKKYPVIFYFYERNSNTLFNYRSPAPSASTINIPYFVSNGYIVCDPDIYYKTGEPGESAYNSVVSAAKYLSKMPWVDSTRMAIQGQSWGGYQVAYLVSRTNIFRAAGAGAPVSNMTSAYGGMRWGTGVNREFQYEKGQSRIGATLWQRPDLYIKNSPLFSADKINTPLLLMHNDADGAVPWYQSIELFTAMRRLGKKVWMLQYNGEDHNLVERKNRKDLSVRLSQFFDYWLKDAKPAEWIKSGVPATQKGINWGLKTEE
ncbi:MAG: prolyl oligopeptidase family serine peptidase [Ferruginibacter sp.]